VRTITTTQIQDGERHLQALEMLGADEALRHTQQTRVRSHLALHTLAQIMGAPWSDMVPYVEPARWDGAPDQTAPHTVVREPLIGEPIGFVEPDDHQLMQALDQAGLIDALIGQQDRSWSDATWDGSQLHLGGDGSAFPDCNDYFVQEARLQAWRASDPKRARLDEHELQALERVRDSGFALWLAQLLGDERAAAFTERLESLIDRGRVVGAPTMRPAHSASLHEPLAPFDPVWSQREALLEGAPLPPQLTSLDHEQQPVRALHEQIEALGAHAAFASQMNVQLGDQTVQLLHVPRMRGTTADAYTRCRWQTGRGATMQLVAATADADDRQRTFLTVQAPDAQPGDISWVIPLDDAGQIDFGSHGWPGLDRLRDDDQLQARLMSELRPLLEAFSLPHSQPELDAPSTAQASPELAPPVRPSATVTSTSGLAGHISW
jgi:hypothetical protein